MLLKDVPHYYQKYIYTCGPASLKMVLGYLGTSSHRDVLRKMANSSEDTGTNYSGMIEAVRLHNHRCFVKKGATLDDVRYFLEMNLPVIVNLYLDKEKVGHFSVVVGLSDKFITLNDPAQGERIRMRNDKFVDHWHDTTKKNRNWMMVVLPKRIKIKTPSGRIFKPKSQIREKDHI